MNRLIQLKAQLQCFAKALFDQIKWNALGEVCRLICCALLLTLVLRSGAACSGDGFPFIPGSGTPTPGPGSGGVQQARTIRFFNCNQDKSSTGGPRGRDYNVWSRVDGGDWVARGGLNIQPGDTDCHDDAHQGGALPPNPSPHASPAPGLDLFAIQQGKWEFRFIKVHRGGELPDCNSLGPPDAKDVPNPCKDIPFFFQTVAEAELVMWDVASP